MYNKLLLEAMLEVIEILSTNGGRRWILPRSDLSSQERARAPGRYTQKPAHARLLLVSFESTHRSSIFRATS